MAGWWRQGWGKLGVAGLILVVAAGACSTARLSRRAHRARVDLEGLSRDDLIACAGEPVRIQEAGAWEYLTYISSLPTKGKGASQCVATFMVRGGYVQGLDYETPNGGLIGKSITECLSIVDPCLPKVEE
jgi:hypothetical protein